MPSYTFPPVTEDHSISVRFSGAGTEYELTKKVITGDATGTITLSPEVGVHPEGTEVTVTCTPAEGYELEGIYLYPPGVPWTVRYEKFNLVTDVQVRAIFNPIQPPTPTGEDVKMYIKENGHWVPLFEE